MLRVLIYILHVLIFVESNKIFVSRANFKVHKAIVEFFTTLIFMPHCAMSLKHTGSLYCNFDIGKMKTKAFYWVTDRIK